MVLAGEGDKEMVKNYRHWLIAIRQLGSKWGFALVLQYLLKCKSIITLTIQSFVKFNRFTIFDSCCCSEMALEFIQ